MWWLVGWCGRRWAYKNTILILQGSEEGLIYTAWQPQSQLYPRQQSHMNGKHHLASGQVVIAEEKNNTLLIQEHTQTRIFTPSLHAPAIFSTLLLYVLLFRSHILFTKVFFLAKWRQILCNIKVVVLVPCNSCNSNWNWGLNTEWNRYRITRAFFAAGNVHFHFE